MALMRLIGHLQDGFKNLTKNNIATVEEILKGPTWPRIEKTIMELAENENCNINVDISHVFK